ncbi:MAG: Bcr/CflA family multidrug efflux MFS transporter [Burkholderiaceae bacterium]|nr:Bcr/CflA family multidrug efflux MFS transporter [Burkholderiaceae bacterium]
MQPPSSPAASLPPPTPTPQGTGFTRWVMLLGFLTAVAPLSIDMYLPGFPQMEKSLNGAPGSIEFTLATFFIGLALGQLLYGPLSDRFGRKPPLYLGFALYTVASVGCALAESVDALCVWRFLQAMGGCAGIVVPSAIVRDRMGARDSARVFSLLMLVMGLAPILAPLVGGWLLEGWGWRAIFWVLTGFGLLCLAFVAWGLGESHATEHEPPLRLGTVMGNYAGLLGNRSYLGFALSGGLVRAGMFAYIAGSPFILIHLYELSPRQYGWFFGANAFGLIACSQINAQLLKKSPPTTLLRRALWVPLLSSLFLSVMALAGWISLTWFAVGFFVFIASVGMVGPNANAAALATHGQMAGTAAALNGSLAFALATLAGALVGALHNGTGQPLALVMLLCGLGAWLSHRFLVRPAPQHG